MLWISILVVGLASGTCAEFSAQAFLDGKAVMELFCAIKEEDNPAPAVKAMNEFLVGVEELSDTKYLNKKINELTDDELKQFLRNSCSGIDKLQACVNDLWQRADHCVPEYMERYVQIMFNGTLNLVEFFCYNNGERFFALHRDVPDNVNGDVEEDNLRNEHKDSSVEPTSPNNLTSNWSNPPGRRSHVTRSRLHKRVPPSKAKPKVKPKAKPKAKPKPKGKKSTNKNIKDKIENFFAEMYTRFRAPTYE